MKKNKRALIIIKLKTRIIILISLYLEIINSFLFILLMHNQAIHNMQNPKTKRPCD